MSKNVSGLCRNTPSFYIRQFRTRYNPAVELGLTYRRRKTGQTFSIEWEQQMQAIVDRYATENATSYLLPLITREDGTERTQYESKMQQVNRNLKKIGQQLGLSIPLTTHCARHSNSHFLLKNK